VADFVYQPYLIDLWMDWVSGRMKGYYEAVGARLLGEQKWRYTIDI
jgi:hypothetical protein